MTWLLAALPLLTLGLTVLNRLTWPRAGGGGPPSVDARDLPAVSVLVPARDEEATIAQAVRSALAEPVAEVVVYDDGSTDRTPDILAAIDGLVASSGVYDEAVAEGQRALDEELNLDEFDRRFRRTLAGT